jgi:hypothetical protein
MKSGLSPTDPKYFFQCPKCRRWYPLYYIASHIDCGICFDCSVEWIDLLEHNLDKDISKMEMSLVLMCGGYTQQQISNIMHLSTRAVRRYLHKIREAGIDALPGWFLDRLNETRKTTKWPKRTKTFRR